MGAPLESHNLAPKAIARCLLGGANRGLLDARPGRTAVGAKPRPQGCHTFASWLVQDGVPLYEVSPWLSHSSIEVTERYAHLAPT